MTRGRSRPPRGRWSEEEATRAIARSALRKDELKEAAFVLRAVGIDHAILHEDGGHRLVVHPEDVLRAREEIARYEDENRAAAEAPPPPPNAPLAPARRGAAVYAFLLVAAYVVQHGRGFDVDWTVLGRTDAGAIRAGEWWRCLTALCLHVDVPHLAGNVIFGAVFGALVAQLLGNGVGWAAIVLAGGLGNAVNALVQQEAHRSLGASTAVFGALGLLTALSLRLRSHLRHGHLRRWAPLAMGIALLGYLGTAGERTDVAAHVLGFVSGLLLGLLFTPVARRGAPGTPMQLLVLALAATAVSAAWWFAVA